MLATLVVGSFGRLGKEVKDSDLIDHKWWQASSEGRTGRPWRGKAFAKNVFFQAISVTTQVAISRRVQADTEGPPQAAINRGRGEETGALVPMTWGWNVDEE